MPMRIDRVGRDIPSRKEWQRYQLRRDAASKRQKETSCKDPIQWSKLPKSERVKWASIDDLPDPLLCNILEYFSLLSLEECSLNFDKEHEMDKSDLGRTMERDDHVEALLDLCLVSKRFARLAQPLLHEYPRELNIQSVRRQFIRTIANRPNLAARVRYVVYEADGPFFKPYKVQASVEMLRIYAIFGAQVKISKKKAFLKALYSGTDDAEMALLFALVPAISTLRVCVKTRWDYSMPWTLRLLKHSIKNYVKHGTHGPFCFLTTFRADRRPWTFDLHPAFVRQIIRLPFIVEFDCRYQSTEEILAQKTWSGSPTLQTLRLHGSYIPKALISTVFNACPNLKHFFCTWNKPGLVARDLQRVMEGIRSGPNSLETLEFIVYNQVDVWEDHLGRKAPWKSIGPLKDFPRLKKLRIPGFFLTGIPHLSWDLDCSRPFANRKVDYTDDIKAFADTLETLEIDCEGPGIEELGEKPTACDVNFTIPYLEQLASLCNSGLLPNLRTLRLRARYSAARPFFEPIIEALAGRSDIVIEFVGFEDGPTSVPQRKAQSPDYAGMIGDIWRVYAVATPKHPGTDMMNVLDLPNEILLEIMSYIDPSGILASNDQLEENGSITLAVPWRLATLARCCLVSKRFCDIARPIMYQTFNHNGSSERRLRFINTITANPQLAALVKEVCLSVASPPWMHMLRNEPPPEFGPMEDDYAELVAKARTMEMSRKEEWLEALLARRQIKDKDKKTDADVPVLLSQVPNLQVLSFCVFDGDIANDYF